MDTCESVEAEPDPIHISPSGFHEKYEFDEVWRNKETREEVRVSIVEKQFVPRDKWSEVAGELDHLRVIQTFGHVTIKEWFDDEKNFYIVQDKIQGKSMFLQATGEDFLQHNSLCLFIIENILFGVRFFHDHGISLYPSFLASCVYIFLRPDGSTFVSLLNFQWKSRYETLREHEPVSPFDEYFLPPEHFKGLVENKFAADMWTVGALAYFVVEGKHAFQPSEEEDIKTVLERGTYRFSRSRWRNKQEERGKDFIRKCLMYNPRKRADVIYAYYHSWIMTVQREENVPIPKEHALKFFSYLGRTLPENSFQQPFLTIKFRG